MHSHGYFPRRNEKKTCHTLRVQELYCLIYSLKMLVLHAVYSLFLFFSWGGVWDAYLKAGVYSILLASRGPPI